MSELSREGLTALTWVFTGAAVALTVGRYAIRLKTIGTLKADDYVHGLALLVLLAFVSTYTVMFPLNYSVEFWIANLAEQPSDSDLRRYFRLEIAVSLLFWVVIYLVKLVFLLFYRFLFGVSKGFVRAWWIVSAFTVVTFLINFLSVFWACEAPPYLFVLEKCLSPRALSINAKTTSMWCGLNVASDISIIILPIWMLRSLQMSMSRKVGLAAIFLIAITDVAFDITRTVYTVNGGAVALDTIWDILEPTIAVIVSSLPTYKALLGNAKTKKKGTSYQNLGRSKGDTWHSGHSHEADVSNDVELGGHTFQIPTETWTKHSSDRSTDTTEIV